jgi:hypothetical protein
MGAASKAGRGSGAADSKSSGAVLLDGGLIYSDTSTSIKSIKVDPDVTAAILPACPRLCPDCLSNREISIRSQVACATRTPHSQHAHATRV